MSHGKIAVLTVDEPVRIDLRRLEQIIGELGEGDCRADHRHGA